jgi:hypothetical protein
MILFGVNLLSSIIVILRHSVLSVVDRIFGVVGFGCILLLLHFSRILLLWLQGLLAIIMLLQSY